MAVENSTGRGHRPGCLWFRGLGLGFDTVHDRADSIRGLVIILVVISIQHLDVRLLFLNFDILDIGLLLFNTWLFVQHVYIRLLCGRCCSS
jgi:hypothetical protein